MGTDDHRSKHGLATHPGHWPRDVAGNDLDGRQSPRGSGVVNDNWDDEDLRWFFEVQPIEYIIGMDLHNLECAIAALANHAVTHNSLLRRDRVALGNALNRLQIVVSAIDAGPFPMLQAAE
jgi:hypothetical protein